MDPTTVDRIVLIGSVGPEIIAALLVLVIALAGTAVGIVMARRGRPEALSLTGGFGFVICAALAALLHLPTRLAVDPHGIDVALWTLRTHHAWADVSNVDLQRGRLGVWLRFTAAGETPWHDVYPPRAGFLIGAPPGELHQLAMRIEAWRLTARR